MKDKEGPLNEHKVLICGRIKH